MKQIVRLAKILLSVLCMQSVFMSSVSAAVPAFPGAEGFGAETTGGRNGKVLEVSSLEDYLATETVIPNSLRSCIEASGPRICIFKTGGSINLKRELLISNPFITIAGQTAPGGGILLRSDAGPEALIHIATHDVVVRYLTLRNGPPQGTKDLNNMAIYKNNGTDLYNIVVDHCSMSWSNDRLLYSWYGPRDFTLQWNLFAEPLSCNRNTKACVEGYGAKSVMLGSGVAGEGSSLPGAREISFHHNLIADAGERNPLVKQAGVADIISNVTYNVSATYAHLDGDLQLADFPVNFISNYYRSGPNGSSEYGVKLSMTGKKPILYFQGNIDSHRQNSTQAENLVMSPNKSTYYTISPTKNTSNPVYPVSVSTCNANPVSGGTCETYGKVVVDGMAGNNRGLDANGNMYTRRDAVDRRILEEVKAGQGKVIDAPGVNTCWSGDTNGCTYLTAADYTKYGIPASDIDTSNTWFNGWPVQAAGVPYPDTDKDGMSDTWETAQFGNLSRGSATDSSSDYDSDGYTDLEEFLNGTNPKDGTATTTTTTPTVTTTTTTTTTPTTTATTTTTPTATVAVVTKPGDANSDNTVDGVDYVIWLQHYGQTVSGVQNGNFDNIGGVDEQDYAVWRNHYGQ